ncbi:MAG: tRNA pseudouridine(38-40) synthase TruA [Candidatus Coatesbacteria bacterium]
MGSSATTTYRLTLEYDGTGFAGWQAQPGRRTVQGEVERACRETCGAAVPVGAAGRTDAGVHAAGQVAGVALRWGRGPDRLREALNAHLPEDIAVTGCAAAPEGFDARRDAVSRAYRYAILLRGARSPLLRRCAWWVRGPLDAGAMRDAARLFEGRRDFSAFTTAQGRARGAVRDVARCRLTARGQLLLLDVEGRSFLHHMVRLIASAVVAAGQGRLSATRIRRSLARLDSDTPVAVAPPQGLALLAVRYRGERRSRLPGWPPGTVA